MKLDQLILLTGITIFSFISCKKNNDDIDNISYSQIHRLLINESSDTIGRLIFEIYKVKDSTTNQSNFKSRLKFFNDSIPVLCDCGVEYLSEISSGNFIAFNFDEKISGSNNWNAIAQINQPNLQEFCGKGERFLGFRNLSYPDGKKRCYYGWLRIYCSLNNDSLRIIDIAINQTENRPIKAGQFN